MDEYSARLLDRVIAVVEVWANRLLDERLASSGGHQSVTEESRRSAVSTARAIAVDGLGRLLALDPESQRTNPLAILREATVPLGDLLTASGVAPIERDEFSVRSFPRDVHGLAPATWAEVDERLVEPGLEWGAFKAASIIARRRDERT